MIRDGRKKELLSGTRNKLDRNHKIIVIILAAGQGKRVGFKPKALLKYNDKTFIESIVEKLNSLNLYDILIVLGYYKDKIEKIASSLELKIIINNNPQIGMFSSVQEGVKSINEKSHIMLWPVDHPGVKIDTLKQIVNVSYLNPQSIIIPAYNKQGGHPTILPPFFIDIIKNADNRKSRTDLLVNNYKELICHVKVNDPAVINDIDFI